MRRRDVVMLGIWGVISPLPLLAQRAGRVWRLGYLGVQTKDGGRTYYEAFMHGMRELGYVEGRNLVVEARYAGGRYERLPALAAELVELRVDVILGSSTPAVSAAKAASTSIPIVMGVAADPLGSGFVKSLARPGGNITGTASANVDYAPKHLELLQRTVPKLSRVGILLNPGNVAHKALLASFERAAAKSAVSVLPKPVRTPDDIEAAFQAYSNAAVGAISVLPDGVLLQQRGQISELAAKWRMPAIYQLREHVEAGGLMSYGQDLHHNHRLAANYVDKIFRGASPADLPVEQSSKLELVINTRAARALGLALPKDVLFIADKIIE
jgi:putative tryptophan/tyrosine transport system substrate-binding protein